MSNKNPNRIHIIGSVGSGKTTLAKKLSKHLNLPYYELDNVVWNRGETEDTRRTEQEREEVLQSIVQSEKWIVEGVHNEDWVASSFQQADVIVFLDTNYSIRTYRIMKRFTKQRLRLEKANYQPSFEIFIKMFKWNRYFEEVGKPNFFNKYEMHREKICVVTNSKEVMDKFC